MPTSVHDKNILNAVSLTDLKGNWKERSSYSILEFELLAPSTRSTFKVKIPLFDMPVKIVI